MRVIDHGPERLAQDFDNRRPTEIVTLKNRALSPGRARGYSSGRARAAANAMTKAGSNAIRLTSRHSHHLEAQGLPLLQWRRCRRYSNGGRNGCEGAMR
jgi:hypothetical protein